MSTLEHIKALRAKQGKLLDELERSLALKELWPEVFDRGTAKSYLVTSMPQGLKGKVSIKCLRVRDGAGTERTFGPDVLPEVLKGGLS